MAILENISRDTGREDRTHTSEMTKSNIKFKNEHYVVSDNGRVGYVMKILDATHFDAHPLYMYDHGNSEYSKMRPGLPVHVQLEVTDIVTFVYGNWEHDQDDEEFEEDYDIANDPEAMRRINAIEVIEQK